jgi:hypothetical protein
MTSDSFGLFRDIVFWMNFNRPDSYMSICFGPQLFAPTELKKPSVTGAFLPALAMFVFHCFG